MNLWLVQDRSGWGYSMNVVRAETVDEAVGLVMGVDEGGHVRHYNKDRVEVTPLSAEGEPAIVWCHDESPDTPGEK
jgi:hypothetical protein